MDFIGAFSPANLNFLLEGFYVTLKIAVISIILSFIIGGAIGPVISGVFLSLYIVPAADIPGTTDPVPSAMAFNLVFLTGAILSFVAIVLCIIMKRTAIKMGAESERAKPKQ